MLAIFILSISLFPMLIGWIADRMFGDPSPHPIVWFGKIISIGEKLLNRGRLRILKGAILSLLLIISVYILTRELLWFFRIINLWLYIIACTVIVFYCLAGKTLVKEVKNVFRAVDSSLEEGRTQVARIVGRDTSSLSAQQVRAAALETLAENLSDGVIAPMFWYAIFGAPGMLAYKMINTLDSMIGYKSERYKQFGCFAARIDDIANYIPARLTALLMIVVSGRLSLLPFVWKNGRKHASPNSGYPEAALAGILGCRFGGPNVYHGQLVDKPYIGDNDREFTYSDMLKACTINLESEILMLFIATVFILISSFIFI
jgi:cobalamin biosynthesis protein CobD